jgi:hypothetical protein
VGFNLSLALGADEEAKEQKTENFNATSVESVRIERFKQTAKKILLSKLTTPEGESAKIYVLKPINYTELTTVDPLVSTIQTSIQSYDPSINLKKSNHMMPSLTLVFS